MKFEDFNALSRQDIAALLHANGPTVGVFAPNGTRRWFQLEHGQQGKLVGTNYFDSVTTRLIELVRLMFDHGVDTLLVPLLSPHLFDTRGEDYTRETVSALSYLTRATKFHDFYAQYGVAARFYGDYGAYLSQSGYTGLLDEINRFNESSPDYPVHRLYWGVCAHDSVNTTINLTTEYYEAYGSAPSRDDLVKRYYGTSLPDVNFFIGASKPRAFDTPLLLNGREDLYFTVAPSPYLNETQFRSILFDHLFSRRKSDSDYEHMSTADWRNLREFYRQNSTQTLGVGSRMHEWGLWQPVGQQAVPVERIEG